MVGAVTQTAATARARRRPRPGRGAAGEQAAQPRPRRRRPRLGRRAAAAPVPGLGQGGNRSSSCTDVTDVATTRTSSTHLVKVAALADAAARRRRPGGADLGRRQRLRPARGEAQALADALHRARPGRRSPAASTSRPRWPTAARSSRPGRPISSASTDRRRAERLDGPRARARAGRRRPGSSPTPTGSASTRSAYAGQAWTRAQRLADREGHARPRCVAATVPATDDDLR